MFAHYLSNSFWQNHKTLSAYKKNGIHVYYSLHLRDQVYEKCTKQL